MTKKVLFVAYNFPPHGGAGVQRSAKFVKYLPEFGWRPLVITTSTDAGPVQDQSLMDDIPTEVPVWRVPGFSISRLRNRLARYGLERLATAISFLLRVPDPARFWARNTHTTISKIVESEHPQVIYTTSGPYSAHLVGMWARRKFHIPWVADFRDPWSKNRLISYFPGYRTINRTMERQVLTSADRIVTVSQPLAEDFQRLSGNSQAKISVIQNGYDTDDVIECPPSRCTHCFTISYTGTFSRLRRPDAFVNAVDTLISRGQIPHDQIKIIVAGKDTEKYIPNRAPYEQLGYLNHSELNDIRCESNLLFLVQDESPANRGAYSGKLFEYLGSNRPILAVTHPDSVAAHLVQRAGAGVVTCHNPSTIADTILDYYEAWKTRNIDYAPNWDIIYQYTRRNLTASLATEFDRLMISEVAS